MRLLSMRGMLVPALLLFPSWLLAQSSIRQVDFKNFTYPRSGPLLGHNRLVWLDPATPGKLHLIDGNGRGRSDGFSLHSVSYGDATGAGSQEAVVVVHYDTGGTQQTDYMYIVALSPAGPKVLAYCYTGDRAYQGLYGARADHGRLIVDLFDPERRQGDCCSTGIIRSTYKWRNNQFVRVGEPQHRAIADPKEEPPSAVN
jgi:hypothetical protein